MLNICAELHQVAEILLTAGPAAAIGVGAVRRRRHLRERDPVGAEAHVMRRVARMQRELGRGVRDQRRDQPAIEAHPRRALRHLRAGRSRQRARLGVEEIHADLFENRERRAMDRLQLILGDDRRRRKPPARLAETASARSARPAGRHGHAARRVARPPSRWSARSSPAGCDPHRRRSIAPARSSGALSARAWAGCRGAGRGSCRPGRASAPAPRPADAGRCCATNRAARRRNARR